MPPWASWCLKWRCERSYMTTNLPVFRDIPEPDTPDKYFFLYWDCHQCGGDQAKHLNAVWEKHCPMCGHPMKDEWCYDDPNAPEIKDRESLMIAKGGSNWNCAYCEKVNFEKAEFCSSCGVSKTSGEKKDEVKVAPKAKVIIVKPTKKSPPRWQGFDLQRVGVALAVIFVLGLLTYGFWWYFLNTKEVAVIADHSYWTASVPMQEYKGIPGSGSSLPANATLDSKSTEVVGYGKIRGEDGVTPVPTMGMVITGYGRCRATQSNSTVIETKCATEESKPVGWGENVVLQYTQVPTYGPHYEYHIMGWSSTSPVITNGFDFNPHPPTIYETNTYKVDGLPQYGYYMYFKESSKDMHVFNQPIPFFTEASWRAAATKQFIGHVNQAGVLIRISETK